MHTQYTQSLCDKQKSVLSWRQFWGCSFPVVTYTQLQTRKERSSLAEQSLGMYSIYLHHIFLELAMHSEKEERKKQTRWTKLEFSHLVLLILIKVSGTYRVNLTNRIAKEVFCKLLHSSASLFWELLLHYVQVAILNLTAPSLLNTCYCTFW